MDYTDPIITDDKPVTRMRRRGGSASELRGQGPGPAAMPQQVDPNEARAFLSGTSEGASAGLLKYPEAMIRSYLENKAYEDSLKAIHERNKSFAENYPGNYMAGNLVGAGGLGLVTGGTGLLPNLARGAGQGAVSGYTANSGQLADMQGLKDTLTGATLGTVAAGTGHAVTAGAKRLGDRLVNMIAEEQLGVAKKAAEKVFKTVGDELNQPGLNTRAKDRIAQKYGYKNFKEYDLKGQASEITPEYHDVMMEIAKEKVGGKQYVRDSFTNLSKDGPPPAGFGTLFGAALSDTGRLAKELVVPAAATFGGSIAGGKSFEALGLPPEAGYSIGALMGGGLTLPQAKAQIMDKLFKETSKAVGGGVLMNPKAGKNIGAVMRSTVAGPVAGNVMKPAAEIPQMEYTDPIVEN